MATSNDQIFSRIGALEGTMKTFIDELREKQRRDDDDREQMERDIRAADAKAQKVKDRQTWMMGMASGLSTAGGALGYLASLYIHSKMGQPQI